MSIILIIESLSLLGLLVCSAFFSSAETALFSLNPVQIHRIRKNHPAAANRIERLLEIPHNLLSTILIGNTLVNVAASIIAYTIARYLYPEHGKVLVVPAMTILVIIFGEVTPKRVAMSHSAKLATLYSSTLIIMVKLISPIRGLLVVISKLIISDTKPGSRTLSEDEFLTVLEVGKEEGVLDEEERDMVDGIISMEEIQASNIMTPRVDLVGIDLDDPLEEQENIARNAKFRFLPVYRGTPDNAQGFIDVPKFLLSTKHSLRRAMIQPFFIPETAPLDKLLSDFQKQNKRIAFVVDEYGGTAGVVTLGDILEEIVDDVENEYGEQKPSIEKAGMDTWLMSGDTSLEDINNELDVNLESEGADRIAGWILDQLEQIPKAGAIVETSFCKVTVKRVRRNRIVLVLFEKIHPSESRKES